MFLLSSTCIERPLQSEYNFSNNFDPCFSPKIKVSSIFKRDSVINYMVNYGIKLRCLSFFIISLIEHVLSGQPVLIPQVRLGSTKRVCFSSM